MKNTFSVILVVLLFGSVIALAQNQGNKQDRQGRMIKMNEKAKSELNLSATQSSKWDEIHLEYFEKIKVLRTDESISEEDKKQDMQLLRKDKEEKIASLLSDDQMKSLVELRKEMRESKKSDKPLQKKGNRGSIMIEMKNDLNLSDGQSQKWDKIISEHRVEMQKLHKDDALTESDKKDKMKIKRGEMQAELMAILNSDQQAIYATKIEDQKKKANKQTKYRTNE